VLQKSCYIRIVLLLGGKKNPELMKGLGSGIKEFKNAAKDGQPADKKEEEIKKKAFHNLKSLYV
jgi:sec-independent protein translocase protein TatA